MQNACKTDIATIVREQEMKLDEISTKSLSYSTTHNL